MNSRLFVFRLLLSDTLNFLLVKLLTPLWPIVKKNALRGLFSSMFRFAFTPFKVQEDDYLPGILSIENCFGFLESVSS